MIPQRYTRPSFGSATSDEAAGSAEGSSSGHYSSTLYSFRDEVNGMTAPSSTTPGESSSSSSMLAQTPGGPIKGEIKPQKACVQCRRSKVKCVHDGQPPCRRCRDARQECKFRLRADDETWRERTDDTLSKLSQAVDTLVSRGLPPPAHTHALPPPQPRSMMVPRATSTSSLYTNQTPYSPARLHGPPMLPGINSGRTPHNGLPPLMSPRSDGAAPDYHTHSPNYDPADATSPGYDRRAIPRKREMPPGFEHDGYAHQHASPQTPSTQAHQRQRRSSSTLMPPPLPPAQLDAEQVLPSPSLSHVFSSTVPLYIPGFGQGPRWMMGSTTSYAKATLTIGRDDPRMNTISIGLVSMERARSLFLFFAEKMQPHSFGFPTYPAAEQMTPVIISAILMVASLHEPYARQLYPTLKNDCMSHMRPEQDVHADLPLDPELGIGVEEITGACIASSWLGGELGWKIARVSRWWTIGYLKHFELPDRNLTVGECLTILPPFRQIDLVDKLRIWIAAYVAEAQQAFILDRPSLVPNCNPMPYVDALRNAFADLPPGPQVHPSPSSGSNGSASDTRGSMTGGSGGALKFPPPPDRQLVGHASILSILLGAQRVQRESRWAAKEGERGNHSQYPSHDGTVDAAAVQDCVERLINCWLTWSDETERWRAEASSLEDLSSSTASALDLTLTHHLAKAHLGSLALEPEYHAKPAVAQAAARDPRLQQVQMHVVTAAKEHALAALELATTSVGFRDRLVFMPGFYHFLLTHAAGFLMLLVQRKGRFLLAGEAKVLMEATEHFTQIFVSEIATHNCHPHARDSVHPSLATAESLARACQHLRAQTRGV